MDSRPASRRLSGDGGLATLEFVLAAALAMLMVVGLVQLIAYQYARGAVMAALERGVRAGSIAGTGAEECDAAVADSLNDVLGGQVGESLSYGCHADGETIAAWATGTVPAWTVGGPHMMFDLEATAQRELEP